MVACSQLKLFGGIFCFLDGGYKNRNFLIWAGVSIFDGMLTFLAAHANGRAGGARLALNCSRVAILGQAG